MDIDVKYLAKEYLAYCDDFCDGDMSVGIPACKFCDEYGCKLMRYLEENNET